MPRHAEKRRLPFSAQQMFDLAADVERYPEFLPWCIDTRIRGRDGDTIHADMTVGFGLLRETFQTHATFDRPQRIDVRYENGPFRHFDSRWQFTPVGDAACEVDFFIDFEFRSPMLQIVMGGMFGEAVRMMVGAFERRARRLYRSA